MNKKNKEILLNKILESIEKSENDILDMERNTQPVKPENSLGRISRMDAINNKSVIEAALRNKRKKLTKLKTALHQINDEGFGNCGNCKTEIQVARLMFMPESNLCVRCAARS